MKSKKTQTKAAGAWAHPLAVVESQTVGDGTRVWAFSHVMAGAIVGKDCNIGEHVFVEKGALIGDRVTVKNGVQVWDGVTLQNDVFVGPNAVFTNDHYPRSPRSAAAGDRYHTPDWLETTHLEEGVTIGANATIICGIRIGRYAVIGAGSVVTRSVPPFGLVFGSPAAFRGYACMCGRPLGRISKSAVCRHCGRTYVFRKDVLQPQSKDDKQRTARGDR